MKPVNALIILDGWGHRNESEHNGILLAKIPYYEQLLQDYPHTLIDGSGQAVGLPQGIMGNSEVGHMNLGAGRIVYSGLSQIYNAIETKAFFENSAFIKACQNVKDHQSTLHLIGLVSDGAVHSHEDHLYALLELAKSHDVKNVVVHCFLDGRDTSPFQGHIHIKNLQQKMKELGIGQIASVSGRFYAMDRDNRWDRIKEAFDVMTQNQVSTQKDVLDYIQSRHDLKEGDEFIKPVALGYPCPMMTHDSVIFFNFRADRARQMTQALTQDDFVTFDRGSFKPPRVFVAMTPYDKNLKADIAFFPDIPEHVLGEVLSEHHLKQVRLAETEKYAHVTYFFNGGRDKAFDNEYRILVPSARDVATYDLKPEMSAPQITKEFLQVINSQETDFVICNFANADMVGHTAHESAIIDSVEAVDKALSLIVPEILKTGGFVIITADHGNAEEIVDKEGLPLTSHTTNLVPFILVSSEHTSCKLKVGGRLCDVAPTILDLLKLPKPDLMTGASLLS